MTTKQVTIDLNEYGGKWVAWDNKHEKIMASGVSLSKVREEAISKGESKPWMDRVPEADSFYSGIAFLT